MKRLSLSPSQKVGVLFRSSCLVILCHRSSYLPFSFPHLPSRSSTSRATKVPGSMQDCGSYRLYRLPSSESRIARHIPWFVLSDLVRSCYSWATRCIQAETAFPPVHSPDLVRSHVMTSLTTALFRANRIAAAIVALRPPTLVLRWPHQSMAHPSSLSPVSRSQSITSAESLHITQEAPHIPARPRTTP